MKEESQNFDRLVEGTYCVSSTAWERDCQLVRAALPPGVSASVGDDWEYVALKCENGLFAGKFGGALLGVKKTEVSRLPKEFSMKDGRHFLILTLPTEGTQ